MKKQIGLRIDTQELQELEKIKHPTQTTHDLIRQIIYNYIEKHKIYKNQKTKEETTQWKT